MAEALSVFLRVQIFGFRIFERMEICMYGSTVDAESDLSFLMNRADWR